MADPYRLVVLKRLTALLEGITIAEGYDFDLAGKVKRGRAIYGENDPPTMLSILEAPQPDFGIYAGDREVRNEGWRLLLQGWTKDDKDNPTDPLYLLAANVENRLRIVKLRKPGTGEPFDPNLFMLGRNEDDAPMLSDFLFSPPVIRVPAENVSSKAFFYMPLTLGLALDVG